MALLHFTSGTTGTPKGAIHVHDAALTHFATGRHALDLHADDIYWCTADPGWVTGTSYGILAPLMHGVTSIVDEAERCNDALTPAPPALVDFASRAFSQPGEGGERGQAVDSGGDQQSKRKLLIQAMRKGIIKFSSR